MEEQILEALRALEAQAVKELLALDPFKKFTEIYSDAMTRAFALTDARIAAESVVSSKLRKVA